MYALVVKQAGQIKINQTCREKELYAMKRIVPSCRKVWPECHWSIHPLHMVIDPNRTNGKNLPPIREGFDPTVGGVQVDG